MLNRDPVFFLRFFYCRCYFSDEKGEYGRNNSEELLFQQPAQVGKCEWKEPGRPQQK